MSGALHFLNAQRGALGPGVRPITAPGPSAFADVKRRGYDIDAYAKLWRHVPDREWQARMYWSRVLPPGHR
jgi:hypothetical protein